MPKNMKASLSFSYDGRCRKLVVFIFLEYFFRILIICESNGFSSRLHITGICERTFYDFAPLGTYLLFAIFLASFFCPIYSPLLEKCSY